MSWANTGIRIITLAALFSGFSFLVAGDAWSSPISDTWVHATVRVENQWGKGATGFLVIRKLDQKQGKVFLVTNKHVIHPDPQMREIALSLNVLLNVREKDGTVLGKSFQVSLTEDGHRLWREHPHPDVDVLAVDVTSLINRHPQIENKGAEYSLFATPRVLREQNITEGEEVLILGYPLGLFHTRIYSPLVRQGIIATKIGERIHIRIRSGSGGIRRLEVPGFLVDAAIIPGSSGSPVVLKPIIGRKVGDKVEMQMATPYLLGIISATETTSIRMEGYSFPTLAGLGIVFDATTIQETIEQFF